MLSKNLDKIWLGVKLLMYIIIPIILIALPATYFDSGDPKCVSIWLLGVECYGCGLTRSMMHLIHFDLSSSLYYHNLGIVIFLLLALVWAGWFWKDAKRFQQIVLQ